MPSFPILVLPLVTIFASAADVPAERVDSGYCRAITVAEGFDLLPCVPAACAPTFCETGVERSDGSLLCVDSDEVYPAGHWATDDWQDDNQICLENGVEVTCPLESVHYTVDY